MFSILTPPVLPSLKAFVYICASGIAGVCATALAVITLPLIVTIPVQLHRISFAPRDIPWVGQKNYTLFSRLRSTLLALKYERANLEEGWEKYSSKGKPFVRPSLHWPSVVLPPSDADWLGQQPEHIIADTKVQDDILGLEWLASGPSNAFIHDFTVIRRDLTRQINACIPEVLDEIKYTFDKHFTKGEDAGDGWKNVSLNDAIRRTVCGVANRIILGLPVCRSEEYYDAVQKWWVFFGLTGLVFRSFVPRPLRGLIMPVLSLPTWYWRRRIVRMFEPEVARRVQIVHEANAAGKSSNSSIDADRSNDLMQWLIEHAARSDDPAEMLPRNLANKLVLFNLFATHTLTTTFTSMITTLLTHDCCEETLSALREEAAQVLSYAASNPAITKQMPLHDSVLRETLRLNPAFDDSMLREVVAPAGVHTPGGTYLPPGSHVAMHTRLMQRSEWSGKGQDWTSFRPFRYCEMAANAKKKVAETNGEDGATDREKVTAVKGQISAVQISDQYMVFGLGKHACPGRFFAASTLKLMLAYLVLEFDMRPFPKDRQPEWVEFGGVSLLKEDTYVSTKKLISTKRPIFS